jgi:hypothetical protein
LLSSKEIVYDENANAYPLYAVNIHLSRSLNLHFPAPPVRHLKAIIAFSGEGSDIFSSGTKTEGFDPEGSGKPSQEH